MLIMTELFYLFSVMNGINKFFGYKGIAELATNICDRNRLCERYNLIWLIFSDEQIERFYKDIKV